MTSIAVDRPSPSGSAAVALRVPLRRSPAVEPVWELRADVVVVGAGAAGLSAARVAAEGGRDVVVLAKGGFDSSATHAAQGGLAAALSSDDGPAIHLSDTLVAGAGLCAESAVDALVRDAPGEVASLRRLGASFDLTASLDADRLALGREGGHSRRRIVHAGGDGSGAEVSSTLAHALPPSVRVVQPVVLIDVLLDASGSAVGVLAGRVGVDGQLVPGRIVASAVVLATGGFGHAWATTSNPPGLTGDGLAAALRAGAAAGDLEFVQFHPTVLYAADATGRRPLVTEALRGEGAVLIDHGGERVMLHEHPLADLAPRDVVAAAMTRRMHAAAPGLDTHLLLDATGLGRDVLDHFERLAAACRAAGIDPAHDPIPVAPGAHYACGGVMTDLAGQTTVTGLLAVGEVATTGVHGANRLASNSLTEALSSGRRCGQLLADRLPRGGSATAIADGPGVDATGRADLAVALSRRLGVVRDAAGIESVLAAAARRPPARPVGSAETSLTLADVEALSLHTVSTAVAAAALVRAESRGCHRRDDHPAASDQWLRRITLAADGDELAVQVGEAIS
jgi:L-aspartate oxidase